MPDTATGYTVRDLARRYRVGVARVIGWIDRGELRALNRRDDRSARPAYVVTPEALAEFERRREAAVAPPPRTPPRKKRTQGQDFYPD
jgi:transposase